MGIWEGAKIAHASMMPIMRQLQILWVYARLHVSMCICKSAHVLQTYAAEEGLTGMMPQLPSQLEHAAELMYRDRDNI